MPNMADMGGGGGARPFAPPLGGPAQLTPFQQQIAQRLGIPSGGGQGFQNSLMRQLALSSQSGGAASPVAPTGTSSNPWANPHQPLGPAIPQPGPYSNGYIFPQGSQQETPLDPYEQLQQQLLAQLQGVRIDATPIEALRSQAEAAANREYDPQISALNAEMEGTKGRATSGQKESRDMYGALATDLANQLPQITQQFKAAEDATTQRYDQAQQQMQQGYNAQQAQQQAVLNQLGISAAMGDPRLQQAATDQQYFTNQRDLSKQQALDALSQMQNTDTGYQNKVSGNTRLAGENRAQEIGKDLETYLQGANAKLGSLNASKASAIEQLLGQLQQADAQRQSQAEQNAFSRIMAMNNFGLDILKTKNSSTQANNDLMLKLMQMQNQGGGNQIGLGAAENFLARAYPQDTSTASALENLLNQVLMSPEVMAGRQVVQDPGTHQNVNAPITDEFVMNKLRQLAQQNNLGGADINNLIDAYLQYKKR